MPRQRCILPTEDLTRVYGQTGSIRHTARVLCASRDTVRARLADHGVEVLDRMCALDIFNRQRLDVPHQQVVHIEQWDSDTLVVRVSTRLKVRCLWPSCTADAGDGALCQRHTQDATEPSILCVWPLCETMVFDSQGLCRSHRKRVFSVAGWASLPTRVD